MRKAKPAKPITKPPLLLCEEAIRAAFVGLNTAQERLPICKRIVGLACDIGGFRIAVSERLLDGQKAEPPKAVLVELQPPGTPGS